MDTARSIGGGVSTANISDSTAFPEVEQEKLDAIEAVCVNVLHNQHSSEKSFRVDRRHINEDLEKFWLEGRALWPYVVETLRTFPAREDVHLFHVHVSVVPNGIDSTKIPKGHEAVAVIAFDAKNELMQRCVLPKGDALPDLDMLAIDGGVLIICQPDSAASTFHDASSFDEFPKTLIYHEMRNADKIQSGDEAYDEKRKLWSARPLTEEELLDEQRRAYASDRRTIEREAQRRAALNTVAAGAVIGGGRSGAFALGPRLQPSFRPIGGVPEETPDMILPTETERQRFIHGLPVSDAAAAELATEGNRVIVEPYGNVVPMGAVIAAGVTGAQAANAATYEPQPMPTNLYNQVNTENASATVANPSQATSYAGVPLGETVGRGENAAAPSQQVLAEALRTAEPVASSTLTELGVGAGAVSAATILSEQPAGVMPTYPERVDMNTPEIQGYTETYRAENIVGAETTANTTENRRSEGPSGETLVVQTADTPVRTGEIAAEAGATTAQGLNEIREGQARISENAPEAEAVAGTAEGRFAELRAEQPGREGERVAGAGAETFHEARHAYDGEGAVEARREQHMNEPSQERNLAAGGHAVEAAHTFAENRPAVEERSVRAAETPRRENSFGNERAVENRTSEARHEEKLGDRILREGERKLREEAEKGPEQHSFEGRTERQQMPSTRERFASTHDTGPSNKEEPRIRTAHEEQRSVAYETPREEQRSARDARGEKSDFASPIFKTAERGSHVKVMDAAFRADATQETKSFTEKMQPPVQSAGNPVSGADQLAAASAAVKGGAGARAKSQPTWVVMAKAGDGSAKQTRSPSQAVDSAFNAEAERETEKLVPPQSRAAKSLVVAPAEQAQKTATETAPAQEPAQNTEQKVIEPAPKANKMLAEAAGKIMPGPAGVVVEAMLKTAASKPSITPSIKIRGKDVQIAALHHPTHHPDAPDPPTEEL